MIRNRLCRERIHQEHKNRIDALAIVENLGCAARLLESVGH